MAHLIIRYPRGHLKFLGHVAFIMIFPHRCRSFKCFSVLLSSVTVFFIYNALIEPKLRHTAYVLSLRRLEIILNNFTGPPACINAEQLTVFYKYTVCREWSYGKLPRKIAREISVENDDFQFENELQAEFDENMQFFLFSTKEAELDFRNVSNFHAISEPWLKYVLWIPYFGRQALLSTFQKFLLQSAIMPQPYTIFKMGNFHERLNPWLLEEIMNEEIFQTFHQLHIQIKAEWGNPAIIQQWMDVIGKLQKHGYSLLKTKVDNGDGKMEGPCFFTSWLKVQKEQPVKAMINPLDPNVNLEERLRDLLTKPTVNCNRKITITVSTVEGHGDARGTALQWPVCVEEMHKPCIVYSAKFGGPETFETSMANLGCTVFLFDPTLNVSDESRGPEKRIRALSLGLGTVNARVVSGLEDTESAGILNYVKANEMAAKLNHQNTVIDVLRLDLHGGEWDVLQNLVSSQLIENYHQIVVTMHIWNGEEVFSLIDRFMRLQKLLNAGFEVFYSHSTDNNLAHDDQQNQSCCFVVGWLKVT